MYSLTGCYCKILQLIKMLHENIVRLHSQPSNDLDILQCHNPLYVSFAPDNISCLSSQCGPVFCRGEGQMCKR
jgi:hypothetical protein